MKRTPLAGRLLQSILGFGRGVLTVDFEGSATSAEVTVQEWSNGAWGSIDETITCYKGLPFDETIEAGKVVWYIYIFKTHFIILAEC